MKKVLLIDDSAADRRIYRRFLGGIEGLVVIEAATGKEAVELCRKEEPDCLVLDYRLPDRTGLEILPELQKAHAAPVILLTGQPEPLLMTEAYRNGIVRYFSKDFLSSGELCDAVREAVGD